MQRETREAVHERNRGHCANCGASDSDSNPDVHHVVPRGRGGFDRLSNLALRCRQCHDVVHGEGTAPTVEFNSTGETTTDSFDTFLAFFRELSPARVDPEEDWRVPKADFERVTDEVGDTHTASPLADGEDS